VGRTSVCESFFKFLSSVISIEGAEYVGPSLASKTGKIVYLRVLENGRITTHEVDNRLGISSG